LLYIGGAILFFYWGLLYALGGADPFSLEGNATIAFDSTVLGVNHLYKGFGIPFDPEGLLSTIPAVVTVILGYLIGALVKEADKASVPKKLLLTGITAVAAGLLWGFFFPINKPLWTSSYVLYTAGWACSVLALLIWIIDLKGYTRWTSFFVVFGMNPLFIFALSGLWARTSGRLVHMAGPNGSTLSCSEWLYSQVFQPLAGDINGSLLYAISHVLAFWLIGYVLYKRKIFIKV
jgi:predicted acyltransferase